ncbi:arginine--tRNA ligase [Rossellomorea vietnamensis]|uniref:Arginine--tRNA ligase n=1 Tax=Rossellomorea vietnamensis TaxID=218284 RepID=A0A5D4M7V9_9BACI|nr:arginine--tRNA ligase [Rossellomorea vietnamensis]TYR98004.1 arginine--tRNA ligase [Rossellomorea vietnamensis]
MNLYDFYASLLEKHLGEDMSKDEINAVIETPKFSHQGDLSFPCFQLAKKKKQSPAAIAGDLAQSLSSSFLAKAEAAGPYVNIFFNGKATGAEIMKGILSQGDEFGRHYFGKDKVITIDMSSPNIAKPFSMGHLRSTVIGNSIALIAEKCGFETVKINYIGDWGTQFGKLITAYKKWGDENKVKENPIPELFSLYKKFHEEAESDPGLNDQGRKAFKQLEDGDPETVELWTWFKNESLDAFQEIYNLLGVSFDSYHGESFYNDKMEAAVEMIKEKGLLETSEGAEVVRLDDEGLPPSLIKKSDGATLYATRDIAAALYRKKTYDFSHALYVVGQEQTIHFRQLFAVLEKLEMPWADKMVHVPFGLFLQGGKKMSTRKGRVTLLEDVLKEAINMAASNIKEKNPGLENAEETARAVGTGAVIFHDLKNDRMNDVEFSLEDMLTFEGETGPYVQYTHARAQSLLRKAGTQEQKEFAGLEDPESWELIKTLNKYPEVIEEAYKYYSPSVVAKYILSVSKAFNKYYGKTRILEENEELPSRLMLVNSVADILCDGLGLLGIKAPTKM